MLFFPSTLSGSFSTCLLLFIMHITADCTCFVSVSVSFISFLLPLLEFFSPFLYLFRYFLSSKYVTCLLNEKCNVQRQRVGNRTIAGEF